MTESKRPAAKTSAAEKEMDKLEKQFDAFDQNIKEMSHDRMKEAPKLDVEPQTKIAQSDLEKSNDIYLKPARAISSREKFNEKFRDDYNFSKEYVQMIAENREIIGEMIELWTKPYPGVPAEFWKVPVNKPVYAPRYVAERIKGCSYHRFVMQDKVTNFDEKGNSYYGSMTVDTTVQRLDAIPVSPKKSIFMGKAA